MSGTAPARVILRIPRRFLGILFRLDPWHLNLPGERDYVSVITSELNARPGEQRDAAIDIGCGLGDIITRLHNRHRIGVDRDLAALKSARILAHLRRQDTLFEQVSFPESDIEGDFDAVSYVES